MKTARGRASSVSQISYLRYKCYIRDWNQLYTIFDRINEPPSMLEIFLHFGSHALVRLNNLNQPTKYRVATIPYHVGRQKWLQAGTLTRLARISSYTRGATLREDWHDGSGAKGTSSIVLLEASLIGSRECSFSLRFCGSTGMCKGIFIELELGR